MIAPTAAKVLVIDDEAWVREAIQDVLATIDLEVLLAADGAAGLSIYGQQAGEIGLVLVDMKMPVMNGAETLRRLRAMDPAVKVILSSGHEAAELAPSLGGTQPTAFLPKPFDIGELIAVVRKVFGLQPAADPPEMAQSGTGLIVDPRPSDRRR